ncbi:hypothetical protein GCM10020358_01240 [Amorphoplanes nipponensis]|uniref:DUF4267 domain-containing protein n=1 Tax=Actinoplanes nipponensis TaxID=135950 RepID=A0A919JD34_9ACTN|nr:DUF4267 domain-containing protein [Actinoplanes nipponensis]GIE48191.1 hypothetical protein Ani05nite_17250 [Actinoplanes nipponensis]
MRRLTTGLAVLCGLAGLFFGLNFLLNPHGAASSFGIEPWPTGAASGYFVVKAMRDIAYGLMIFAVFVTGSRRTLGWVILAAVTIPLGDAAAVVTHGGSWATALAVHGSAVVLVVLTATLLLRETGAGGSGTDTVRGDAHGLSHRRDSSHRSEGSRRP